MTDTTSEHGLGVLTDGCRLTLAARLPVVRVGSPVVLSVVLANEGSTPIQFPRVSMWFEYDYVVSSGAGEPVALTPLGQEKQRSMQEQGGTLLEIQPGARMSSSVELSALYEFSRPGTYTITASKTLPNPAGDGFVKMASNSVTVRVEAGPSRTDSR